MNTLESASGLKSMSNPHIVSDGKNTRFGQAGGADPVCAARKSLHSRPFCKELKYLAAQRAEGGVLEDLMKGVPSPTNIQVIAAALLQRALDGDVRAFIFVTNAIDGKVPTYNPNADFRRIEKMTDKELDDLIRKCGKKTVALHATA